MRRALHRFWHHFKRLSQALGNFIARIILTLFYFVAMAPFAVMTRWRVKPLASADLPASAWRARPTAGDDLTRARRQF